MPTQFVMNSAKLQTKKTLLKNRLTSVVVKKKNHYLGVNDLFMQI